jgi:hypothetical protein
MDERTNPSGDRADRELHPIAVFAAHAYCQGDQGRPGFSEESLEHISEMARALLIADDHELDWAARSVGKLMTAIQSSFGDVLSTAHLFTACLPAMPALRRANELLFIELQERDQKVMHEFHAFSDRKSVVCAPRFGAAPPAEGIVLSAILPPAKIGR